MNIGNILYTIFIGPLKLLFEVVYSNAYYLTGSSGLSIVALSLVMNILLLPLYNQADKVQEEENKTQLNMKKYVDHIKECFKGDEQYMVLNTYYRQNNYKPIYALRSSLSLLLQIPFFIAAYDFLSNEYTVLSSGFGPIANLGNPDHLLGGINLLPILMTLINIVSSFIYTKGQPLKSKIQLYVMALAFLVFLYNRPSGLVFYWTLNNLFSLIKNIFLKIKNSDFVLAIICCTISVIGLVYVFIRPFPTLTINIAICVILSLLLLPMLFYVLKKKNIVLLRDTKVNNVLYYLEVLFLCLLFGLYIPSQVIGSSPNEFIDTATLVNPMSYIFNTNFLAIGVFGVWFTIFYSLMNNSIKKIIQYILMIVCVVALVDFLFFGKNLGAMSNLLVYDNGMIISSNEHIKNLLCVIGIVVVLTIVYFWKKQLFNSVLIISIIMMTILSITSLSKISRDVSLAMGEINTSKGAKATIELSKNGKNVVVVIFDRAINRYFPYLLNEKPELQKSFEGFVYYPNTVSYGRSTNLGIPAVYGGYEYTPEELDKRNEEYLPDKHNEALRMMPVLFDNSGFNVTVFDPCYANYQYPSDLSIFNDYENIRRFNTEIGMFEYDKSIVKNNLDLLNRNLFCYGITRAVPTILQSIMYNGGAYNSVSQYETMFSKDQKSNMSFQAYVKSGFMNCFSVLLNMVDITNVNDNNEDYMLLMYNNSSHEPTLMQEPDYELTKNVDNYEYDIATNFARSDAQGNQIHFENYNQISHYHVNMKTALEFAKWLDYLKKEGVYDNTRIIVVADHGRDLGHFEDMMFTYSDGEVVDLMLYNPLLLFKDFDSHELITDNTFMTNADTPILATKDVIDNPVNPFTGKQINDEIKRAGDQHIFMSDNYFININNGKTFIPGKWLYVHDNIFDLKNWYEE